MKKLFQSQREETSSDKKQTGFDNMAAQFNINNVELDQKRTDTLVSQKWERISGNVFVLDFLKFYTNFKEGLKEGQTKKQLSTNNKFHKNYHTSLKNLMRTSSDFYDNISSLNFFDKNFLPDDANHFEELRKYSQQCIQRLAQILLFILPIPKIPKKEKQNQKTLIKDGKTLSDYDKTTFLEALKRNIQVKIDGDFDLSLIEPETFSYDKVIKEKLKKQCEQINGKKSMWIISDFLGTAANFDSEEPAKFYFQLKKNPFFKEWKDKDEKKQLGVSMKQVSDFIKNRNATCENPILNKLFQKFENSLNQNNMFANICQIIKLIIAASCEDREQLENRLENS